MPSIMSPYVVHSSSLSPHAHACLRGELAVAGQRLWPFFIWIVTADGIGRMIACIVSAGG